MRTLTEAELRNYKANGVTWAEVARKTGWPSVSIRITASVLGLTDLQSDANAKDKFVNDVIRSLAFGASLKEIAKQQKIGLTTLYQRMYRRGLPTTCHEAIEYITNNGEML